MITSIPQKLCYRCKNIYPLDFFGGNRSRYDGKNSECKACSKVLNKTRYAGKHITKGMRSVGFTLADFQRELERQNGKCAICQKPETGVNQWGIKKLAVDHDHVTGKFRGLLCQICNTKLAVLEDQDFVNKAKQYLN